MRCENLWRINIKPNSKESVNPRRFCLEKNILGVGWAVGESDNMTWKEYESKALKKYCYEDKNNSKKKKVPRSWKVATNIVNKNMKIGDLCWTRDELGVYYLGRIIGEWEYKSTQEYINADIVNVRKCEWIKVGLIDEVPGKVINSFATRSTVQKVWDNTALEYSKLLYNQYTKDEKYELNLENKSIFSLLSPDDCENVIGLYLQKEEGYYIIPKTNRLDTVKYEFVLKHKDSGKKAIVQVKSGNVNLNLDEFKGLADEVFLFTTEGKYEGNLDESIKKLNKQVIEKFIFDNIYKNNARCNSKMD
ncbi:hypothetical protein H9660_13560 [Clostridium sp. Sa3CUN1]|uniref:Uncharacterized protein n=1 Tax=Clostridium gallinarum TaxID=2762246 RepID=A0ABR8Q6W5_9CLOT|nr:hypothetical protein [Clostridium gallinarum]MBD7916172.1 hypothetical protein [Clostridium gallinarum]